MHECVLKYFLYVCINVLLCHILILLMNTVYIELGGNMGDRLQLIDSAKASLLNLQCEIIKQSSIYETPPWGFSADLNFYNQIVVVDTELTSDKLLLELQKIEALLGRVRGEERYESRTMDIDILFFNSDVIDEKDLTIPHPRLHLRKFVLIPMNEIAPNFIHPALNLPIAKLLQDCSDRSECVKV